MINPIKELCDAYFNMSIVTSKRDGVYHVTLPILDRLNDWMSVRVEVANNRCRISDCGYVYQDLELAGITYIPGSDSKNSIIIDTIKNNLQCSFDNDISEFYLECSLDELGRKLLYFLQAISHIDFVAYGTQGFVSNNHVRFRFTVSSYFRSKDCVYEEEPEYKGAKGFSHSFNYRMANGCIVDLLSENNLNYKYAIMYKWDDARAGELSSYDRSLYVLENYPRSVKLKAIDEAMDNNDIIRFSWDDKSLIDRYIVGI